MTDHRSGSTARRTVTRLPRRSDRSGYCIRTLELIGCHGSASAAAGRRSVPPPSLTTTIRTGTRRPPESRARLPRSCWKPRSPVMIVVGRPVDVAAPIPEAISPSIPLAPRLARRRARRCRRPGRNRLLVPDGQAGGGVDEVSVPVKTGRGPGGRPPAVTGPVWQAGCSIASVAACRFCFEPGLRETAGVAAARPDGATASDSSSSTGPALTIRSAVRSGSYQPQPGSITI